MNDEDADGIDDLVCTDDIEHDWSSVPVGGSGECPQVHGRTVLLRRGGTVSTFNPGDRVITPNGGLGTVDRMEDGVPMRVVVDGVSWVAADVKPLVGEWGEGS